MTKNTAGRMHILGCIHLFFLPGKEVHPPRKALAGVVRPRPRGASLILYVVIALPPGKALAY